MTAGLSRYVPFNTSGQMGADPYHFRSGFNAGISFCEDCRPLDYPRGLLKLYIYGYLNRIQSSRRLERA